MCAVAPLVVVLVIWAATSAHAGDDDRNEQVLHLSTPEVIQSVEKLPKRHPLDPQNLIDSIADYVENEEIGVGRFFTLLPAEDAEIGEIKPPRFAFIARAHGRTLISITQPGPAADAEDRVLLQRWLVSDLLKGRRYSLTVYKEHTLDKDTMHFLGVGARLLIKPDFHIANWRFRVELFGSYHPQHEATAYLALTGRSIPPAPLPLPGGAARAARDQGTLVPLRW
jgi:hypothetical protein